MSPSGRFRAVDLDTRPVGPPPVASASIVIATHNDGANIGALLRRTLAEPCVGEVLVLASETTDDTLSIVADSAGRSGGRVRLFVEDRRSGKAAAVNFGLTQTRWPVAVIVSGDVLPEPGAIGLVVDSLGAPGVGMAGGRPAPVNADDCLVGHAVQLLWWMHHRLALHQPKLGEMIGIRAEAVVSLPRTSVDEATFQALLERAGWRSVYVPQAVVANRGPETVADFVKQRRQVHAGHLWLRHRQGYTVPSLRSRWLATELWQHLWADRRQLRPVRLTWTAATVAMEVWARLRARVDFAAGRENHVWTMVESAKDPTLGPHRLRPGRGQLLAGPGVAEAAADQRGDQHQLPVQLHLRDVQRVRTQGEGAGG